MHNEKKVVPKLRQEVKVKVDIVTSDDIKIYYTGKFQDFTARYMINLKHKCGVEKKCKKVILFETKPAARHEVKLFIGNNMLVKNVPVGISTLGYYGMIYASLSKSF